MSDELIKIIHTFNINNFFDTNPLYMDSIETWKKSNPDFKIMVHTENEPDFIDFINETTYNKSIIYSKDKGWNMRILCSYLVYCYLYKYGGFFIEADMQVNCKLEDYYDNITTLAINNNNISAQTAYGPIYMKLNDVIARDFIEYYNTNNPIYVPECIDIPYKSDYKINNIFNIPRTYIPHFISIQNSFSIHNPEIDIWSSKYKKLYATYTALNKKTKYYDDNNVVILGLYSNEYIPYNRRFIKFGTKKAIDDYIYYKFYYLNIPRLVEIGLIEYDND